MAYSHGTPNSIVKDGLEFYIDPANIRSYPSGSAKCFSLIGNGSGSLQSLGMFNSDNAGSFDCTVGQYIDTNHYFTTGANPKSFSLWFYQKTDSWPTSNYPYLISGGTKIGEQAFGISIAATPVYLQFSGWSGGDFNVNFVLETKKWYNVAATYDGTDSKVYINGELVKTESNNSLNTSDANSIKIGRVMTGDSQGGDLNAFITGIKIYNKALSLSETKQNYRALKGRFI
jgi:hypothetical protein|tara:strand:- start:712 stop:1401 length:690 start_codon:yes stop_codon:yes gene_type:complete